MKEFINICLSSLYTFFIFFLGGFDIALQCLLILIVLDYITGIIKSYINKNLSSSIGFRGIVKKISILILVMLSVMIDRVTGESGAVRTLVIYYFVANEGLSIIENLGEAGLPIPNSIKKALLSLKKEDEKEE